MTEQQTTDVLIENHGTIFLFRPQTDTARDWIEESVSDEAQWFGNALVVEHRYAGGLAQGMHDSGLRVTYDMVRMT